MLHRREALIRLGQSSLGGLALAGRAGATPAARPQADDRTAGAAPRIDHPIPFNTPEADRILAAFQAFPPDNPWNQDISDWPTHPNSDALIASIGGDRPLRYNPDMAFVLVPPDQRRIPVRLGSYAGESDRGPFPVPDNLPIEGWPAAYRRSGDPRTRALTLEQIQWDVLGEGGDRHAIVVDPVGGRLHEFFGTRRTHAGWQAQQASTFDLKSNRLRPEGWTSADAAGLPIFPAVVRFDELHRGLINHALRVTVRRTRRAHVHPARHHAGASDDPGLPRMGERIRLRRDYPIARFSPPVRTILAALQRHGMFVADNGIEWAISVTPDKRIPVLHEELRRVRGSAFEVVRRPD